MAAERNDRNGHPATPARPLPHPAAITQCTLVLGASAAQREMAIAEALRPDLDTAVLLEGLSGISDGQSRLQGNATLPKLVVVCITPGCVCCTGSLPMRVTLNRLLRGKPQRLFIALASTDHLDEIRRFLAASPYDALLHLTDDLLG